MKRRWGIGLGVVLVCLLGAWLLWGSGEPFPAPRPPPKSSSPITHRPASWNPPQALSVLPEPRGTSRLAGRVLGSRGPVAGALVVATVRPPLEELTGPSLVGAPRSGCDQSPGTIQFLELAHRHRSKAPVLARAFTDARGYFRLEGLEAGTYRLWAETREEVGAPREVVAGSEDLEVTVNPGRLLSGEVRDEQGQALAGVRVMTFLREAGRFVEVLSDEAGRFVLGPLPPVQEPVVLSKEGFLASSAEWRRREVWWEEPRTVKLLTSRRLSGQVLDERGPVPGARVELEGLAHVSAVSTDARGQFELAGLCPGRHLLRASQGGLLTRQWVFVQEGRNRESVELLLLPAVRLSVRVSDASGRALGDVEVSVAGGEPPQTLKAKTDARGQVPFELTPGRYALTFQAAHHVPVRWPSRLIESSRELAITLEQGEPLAGHVVDERGSPVRDAELRLTGASTGEGVLARSQADGAFALEVPAARAGRLLVSHPDFLPETHAYSAPTPDTRVVLRGGGVLEVEVVDEEGRPQDHAEVGVTGQGMHPRSAITGREGRAVFRSLAPGLYTVNALPARGGRRVQRQQEVGQEPIQLRLQFQEGWILSGQVVDAGGTPLEGVSLRGINPRITSGPLESASLDWSMVAPVRTMSDAEGRFTLGPLTRGDWLLDVTAPELELDLEASRGVDGWKGGGARVTPGESSVRLVIQDGARIQGRVRRENGEPVTLFTINDQIKSDPEGRFSIPFGRNRQHLRFEAPELIPVTRQVSSRSELDLGDVVLGATQTLRGRVTDTRTSAPVVRALVRSNVHPPGLHEALTYTRSDGTFTLPGVSPARRWIMVEHPAYPVLRRPLEIPDFTQEIQVRLEPGASVQGRVESQGKPVHEGTVQVRTEQGDILGTTEIWRGRYALRPIRAGRHVIQVKGPRDAGPSLLFPLRSVELAPGDQVTLDFTEQIAGVAVEVLVPEQDIEVHLLPGEMPLLGPKEGLYRKLTTGFMGRGVREGVRRFSHLPAGSYTLIAIRRDEAGTEVHRETLEVPTEGDVTFTLLPLWQLYED